MKKFFRSGSGRAQATGKGSSTPDSRVTAAVQSFCDSGAPNNPNAGGNEITYLPTIVEGAESSPAIAGAAAYKLRKLLKDGYSRPYIQYNAIMLMRILTDNPGPQFTRHIDQKFIHTIHTVLTQSKDPSVQQILRETLFYFQSTRSRDENLNALLSMWQHEQSAHPGGRHAPHPSIPPQPRPPQRRLPQPDELAQRIAEAKTSAQLLIQLSQSTPPAEVHGNELMREFAERVQAANRNLHGYMNCTDPAPDEPTFRTLIETCDQLSVASSRHQRAVLAARQQMGLSPPVGAQQGGSPSSVQGQALPPPQQQGFQQQSPPQAQPPMQPSRQQQEQQQRASYIPGTVLTPARSNPQRMSQPLPPRRSQQPAQPVLHASNPFSDDAQIAPQQHPYAQNQANGNTQPTNNLYELPGSTAQADYAAPSGPPPNKIPSVHTQQIHADDDEDDDYGLYGTGNTPVTQRQSAQIPSPRANGPSDTLSPTYTQNKLDAIATPARSNQDPTYSTAQNDAYARSSQPQGQSNSLSPTSSSQRPNFPTTTPSYLQRQDDAMNGGVMSGGDADQGMGAGQTATGSKSGRRVKDDEPMTPLMPSAWR